FVIPIIWAMSCSCSTSPPAAWDCLSTVCVWAAWGSRVESEVCCRAATCEPPTTSWFPAWYCARCCDTGVPLGGGPDGKRELYSESMRASWELIERTPQVSELK